MPIRIFGNRTLEKLLLKREPTNEKDCSAVAVTKEIQVVGHVYPLTSDLLYQCFCVESAIRGLLK